LRSKELNGDWDRCHGADGEQGPADGAPLVAAAEPVGQEQGESRASHGAGAGD
jgi:hypothetical protein